MKKSLFIIGVILCGIGPFIVLSGTIYTLLLPNIYSSTAVVQLTFPENESEKYTEKALVALTRQQATLVKSTPILYSAIEELQLQTLWGTDGEKLPRQVALKILGNSVNVFSDRRAVGLIRIAVQRDNPNEAAKIANAISQAYQDNHKDVTIVETAEPNIRPVSPNLFMNVLLSLGLAAISMVVGAILIIIGAKSGGEPAGELASRGKRLGGALLDTLISVVVTVPIMFAFGIFGQMTQGQRMSLGQAAISFFLGLATFLIIHGYLLSKHGQTVGKKLVGTRIVSKENGNILPLGKVFALRVLPVSLMGQIPVIGGVFGLADALFIFRKDKRCIHDLIAGTIVVNAETRPSQTSEVIN